MLAKHAILQSIGMADMIVDKYLSDLPDEAFFARPVAGMNTVAWQVGHLITTERNMVEGVKPGSCPALPEGFEARHAQSQEIAELDDPSQFSTKPEYLSLWKTQRAATQAALESMSEAELDAPAPEKLLRMCPTVGAVFNLTGLHALMHAGQFVAVRRHGKLPIAM